MTLKQDGEFVCGCGSRVFYGKGMCKSCYMKQYIQDPAVKRRRAEIERKRRSVKRDEYRRKEKERNARRSASRRKYNRAYYQANADRLRHYQIEYRKKEKEKTRFMWRRTNIRRRQAQFDVTLEQWQRIVDFYVAEGLCPCCTLPFDDNDIRRKIVMDHVIPISRGGMGTAQNIQPLCRSCNSSKSDHNENDYRFDRGAYACLV